MRFHPQHAARQHVAPLRTAQARIPRAARPRGRSTVVPTFANPRHKPPADPEADFGFKTANRGRERSELQLGYRAHFAACADTELPLAWKLTKASRNDSPELRPLLDAVLLGFANLLRAAPQLA